MHSVCKDWGNESESVNLWYDGAGQGIAVGHFILTFYVRNAVFRYIFGFIAFIHTPYLAKSVSLSVEEHNC